MTFQDIFQELEHIRSGNVSGIQIQIFELPL